MPSNHLILCGPLLLLPSIFLSIRVFSNESILLIRWPKDSFNCSVADCLPRLFPSFESLSGLLFWNQCKVDAVTLCGVLGDTGYIDLGACVFKARPKLVAPFCGVGVPKESRHAQRNGSLLMTIGDSFESSSTLKQLPCGMCI